MNIYIYGHESVVVELGGSFCVCLELRTLWWLVNWHHFLEMLLLKLCFDRRKEDILCASVVSSYAGACRTRSRGHREPGRGKHSLEGSLLVEYGGKGFQVMGSCLTMKAWPQVEEPRLDRTSGKGDNEERCVGNHAKDGVADGLVLRNREESNVNRQGAGRRKQPSIMLLANCALWFHNDLFIIPPPLLPKT